MIVLDGQEVALKHRQAIKEQVSVFKFKFGRPPGLTVILVGEDPASQVYVRNKVKACEEAGIVSKEIKLPASVESSQLKSHIVKLNEDLSVDGILVQLPLPKNLNSDEVLSWIDPRKDPDGLTIENIGLMWSNRARVLPCTPSGVMAILEHYKIPVAGRHAVVIGRSNIVGKPMAQMLLHANATVTVCHSHTTNLAQITSLADIVVVAAGQAQMLGRGHVKQGAVVIDVGIHRLADGKLAGDVRFEELKGWAYAATPVPKGVGPMTITMLLANTVRLAELRLNLKN